MQARFSRLLSALTLAMLGLAFGTTRLPLASYASQHPAEAAVTRGSGISAGTVPVDQYGPYSPGPSAPNPQPAPGPTYPSGSTGSVTTLPASQAGAELSAPDDCWLYDSWCAYCTNHPDAALCAQFAPGHRTMSAGGQLMFGAFAYNNHGMADARGKTELAVQVDSYYFEPTFLQGTPGQTLKLHIENESGDLHNFSVMGQSVSMDIPAHGKVDVDITFPQSGAGRFYCKFHTSRGMNGELLAGSATPQAAP
jgi:plastocyanin